MRRPLPPCVRDYECLPTVRVSTPGGIEGVIREVRLGCHDHPLPVARPGRGVRKVGQKAKGICGGR